MVPLALPSAESAANSKNSKSPASSEKTQAINQITEYDVLASKECCKEKEVLHEEGGLPG